VTASGQDSTPGAARWACAAAALIAVAVAGAQLGEPVHQRTIWLAGLVLVLWLFELVPPFVPTLLLALGTTTALAPLDPRFTLTRVLAWPAEPVMLLFFGGFTLSAAAQHHGLDRALARAAIALSGGNQRRLVALVMGATALLSMWMSNVAAAAMMLAAVRPVLSAQPERSGFPRAILVALAMGANLGGIATPVGTGPNALAINALGATHPISFPRWMLFALPLTVALLAAAYAAILVLLRPRGAFEVPVAERPSRIPHRLVILAALAILAWLTEPLHQVPAAIVALALSAALFAMRLLDTNALAKLDWSTLMLIGGGLMLGRLLEESLVLRSFSASVDWGALSPMLRTLAFVGVAAVGSALMSNTATAALLIPLAMAAAPSASVPVLIAVGCSLGIPFAVSTPPNAMARGAGLPSSDLLRVGIPLMVLGALAVVLTGPWVLAWAGLR
jgi:sodium-dependent dicarboxylate transporter 2/3/5